MGKINGNHEQSEDFLITEKVSKLVVAFEI